MLLTNSPPYIIIIHYINKNKTHHNIILNHQQFTAESQKKEEKMDYAQRHEYVKALEEERGKIMVFQRELPLCLHLVNQAIEMCRRELSGTTTEYMQGQQSECSEQTTCDGGPVLEEFIPIKRSSCSDDEDEEDEDEPKISCNTDKKKSDWLRSVQLWNSSIDPPLNEDAPATVVEVEKNGGAFQPFQKQENVSKSISKEPQPTNKPNQKTVAVPATSASSTEETGGKAEEKDGQNNSQRKQRRCWSPELHRRFLHALQQLGGSHTATPKQIRELMKVDGLTNDEVKSHLQKYRLHTRRPNASSAHHNNNNVTPQVAPQFLVVGGIWVPPPEYATIATTTTLGEGGSHTNPIYAPIAAPPQPQPQQHSSESLTRKQKAKYSDHMVSNGRGRCGESSSNSHSTSSSTHTTTTSPTVL